MKHPGAKFEAGDTVLIADRAVLEKFRDSWKWHHPLQLEQLGHAGAVTKVSQALMYHGGDILYVLEGVPGIWHQQLVDAPSARRYA